MPVLNGPPIRIRAQVSPTRYFTGKPCKHGHVSERLVSDGGCVRCGQLQRKARRQLQKILGLGKRPKQSTEARRAQNARARLRQKQTDPEGYRKKRVEEKARSRLRQKMLDPEGYRTTRGAQSRRWRQNHPEQRAVQRRQYKLKRRGVPGKHTVAELRARYAEQEGRCFWCRESLPKEYHRDHVVPVSKGGTNDIRNIVLACAPCNVRKSDTHPLELLLA